MKQVVNETARAIPLYGKVVLPAHSSMHAHVERIRPEVLRLLKVEDICPRVNPRSITAPVKQEAAVEATTVFQEVIAQVKKGRRKR